jgi:NAD-dependent SIR2 family protein deacetylase
MGMIQDIKLMGEQEHPNKYEEIINGLKSGTFKNIIFITGAGISTSAGIPDFRSKGGLFEQTRIKYGLSRPEQFFQIDYFYSHPEAFYDFCKGFDISECRPTKTHLFMGFLNNEKKIVKRIYTQNVDGLELLAGVPRNKMTFAHGTITEAGCPNCLKEYDIEEVRKNVMAGKILYCSKCKKPIKPKVVFYGENLPDSFFQDFDDINVTDLAFIMGSSLAVYPFNQLHYGIKKEAWRVLVNKDEVGNFLAGLVTMNQFRFDNPKRKDLFLNGYTDEIVQKIVDDCGWKKEFDDYCKIWLDQFEENLKIEKAKKAGGQPIEEVKK